MATTLPIPFPLLLAGDAAWEFFRYTYVITFYPFRCAYSLFGKSFHEGCPIILELITALISITWGIYIACWDWSVFSHVYPDIIQRLGSIPIWTAWFTLSGLGQLFLCAHGPRLLRAGVMAVHIFNWTFWSLAMFLGTPTPMTTFGTMWFGLISTLGHVLLMRGWNGRT